MRKPIMCFFIHRVQREDVSLNDINMVIWQDDIFSNKLKKLGTSEAHAHHNLFGPQLGDMQLVFKRTMLSIVLIFEENETIKRCLKGKYNY